MTNKEVECSQAINIMNRTSCMRFSLKCFHSTLLNKINFWFQHAPKGAQGVTIRVFLSVRPSSPKLKHIQIFSIAKIGENGKNFHLIFVYQNYSEWPEMDL